jgi:cytochrome bd ubiquinol oxidase subunit I
VITSIGVAFVGHEQAQHLTEAQPMKIASAEALWDTTTGAPLSLFAVGDVDNRENIVDIGSRAGCRCWRPTPSTARSRG